MQVFKTVVYWSLFFSLLFSLSWADEKKEREEEKTVCDEKEEFFETKHQVIVNGQPIDYRAVAGTLILKDEKCKPKASMFYISYTKEGVDSLKENLLRTMYAVQE